VLDTNQSVCTAPPRLLELESDSKLKLHSEDMSMPAVPSSERHEVSLRQSLKRFLDKLDYSFTSYPEFNGLELAVRNEILSFGVDLRPGWETILHTSCTLISMGYPKHPFEIQFSITVCGAFVLLCGALIHSSAC
jgi:hypothetical protein